MFNIDYRKGIFADTIRAMPMSKIIMMKRSVL